MATTNIQIFNKNQNNALPDNEYTNCTERNNGFLGVLARANVFNKFCYQVSLVCKAIADFMVNKGFNANDSVASTFTTNFEKAIVSVIANEINSRVPNTRAKNKTYKKGDIVADASLPLWGELECITAGTTSNSDFSSLLPNPVNYIGLQIQDGSVLWVLRAKRFSFPKNTPIAFNGQFVAHQVLENGTAKTYYVPKHPETGLEMLDYRYCDGQTVGGFSTINMQNRFLMCKGSATAGNGNAGADEVAITRNQLPTGNFGLSLTCNDWNKTFKFDAKEFTSGGREFSDNDGKEKPHNHIIKHTGEMVWAKDGEGTGQAVKSFAGGSLTSEKTSINQDHKHKVKISYPNIEATHRHGIAGTVTLNSNAQQKISVVSQHYKIAYIQRIY